MTSRLFLIAAVLLLVARPSYAYIDPNAGSILAQLVVGGAGLLVLLRLFWGRVRSLFSSKNEK